MDISWLDDLQYSTGGGSKFVVYILAKQQTCSLNIVYNTTALNHVWVKITIKNNNKETKNNIIIIRNDMYNV